MTPTPVFHLYNHTLELFDEGNMIPHDKKRRAKNMSVANDSKGIDIINKDKIEKINLFSSIIKKDGDPG